MAPPFIAMPHIRRKSHGVSIAPVAAAALFLRNGIEAVRMTDIAAASGVGVATLYRHYKTKTALTIRAGAYMWNRFNVLVRHAIVDEGYHTATGADRLTILFSTYCDAYIAHPDFVRFLDEFDHMLLAEGVSSDELASYGEAVDSFYFLFEDAYTRGLDDGTITRRVDFPVLYRTVAHAMMAIAQKLVRGDIIPSDDFSKGRNELDCIVQMARCTLGIESEE